MTGAFLTDAFQAFLEEPSRGNYRLVRRLTLAASDFDRHSLDLAELSTLCDEGRFEQVYQRSQDMWPRWRLSPRFHLLVAYAAHRLGDREEKELSRFQFHACLEGLLSTGNGTAADPYEVVYTSDEYDVIRALGRQARGQHVAERKGQCLDVIRCEDGADIWFDLGPMVQTKSNRRFNRWVDQIPIQVLHHF